MKRINFVQTKNPIYREVLNTFIYPILKHLPEAIVSEGCIYGAINVIFFIEWHECPLLEGSVFLPHGIADKGYRNGNVVDKFDYVCVTGPVWKEKLIHEGVDESKILIIGYPRLDPFFNGSIQKTPSDKKRVLWAPTHSSISELSSYHTLGDVLSKLPEDEYELILSVHPANDENHKVTMQALIDADIVVTDTGSMIYEAWALGKQVVFPDYLVKDAIVGNATYESHIYEHAIGLHAVNEEQLIELIISGTDKPLDSDVVDFMEEIFPKELRGISGKTCADALMDIASKGSPNQLFRRVENLYRHEPLWQMSPSERASILHIIENLPIKTCAIEIGSFKGGFLKNLSSYFAKVYSCDIDHSELDKPFQYTNVVYTTGDSKETVPGLISQINESGEYLSFVLIDGDHSYDGVFQDIKNVLEYIPTCETIILIHDSWYQPLRQAILDTDFNANPYVKHVEVDFVPGDLFDSPSEGRVFIGGLAMVLLSPNKRQSDLAIKSSSQHMYNTLSELLSKQRES